MASGPTENPGPQERSHGSDQALPCGGDCFVKDVVGGWRRKLSSSLCSVGGQYDACRGAGPEQHGLLTALSMSTASLGLGLTPHLPARRLAEQVKAHPVPTMRNFTKLLAHVPISDLYLLQHDTQKGGQAQQILNFMNLWTQ